MFSGKSIVASPTWIETRAVLLDTGPVVLIPQMQAMSLRILTRLFESCLANNNTSAWKDSFITVLLHDEPTVATIANDIHPFLHLVIGCYVFCVHKTNLLLGCIENSADFSIQCLKC